MTRFGLTLVAVFLSAIACLIIAAWLTGPYAP